MITVTPPSLHQKSTCDWNTLNQQKQPQIKQERRYGFLPMYWLVRPQ